jgi:hypothetical protein
MALSLCLLPDDRSDRAVRRLWHRLETEGITTLLSHTHGHHVPHLSFASLRSYDLPAVTKVLGALPPAAVTAIQFDALGLFRRSRCWLLPAVTGDLLSRQEAAVHALLPTGADLHRHYVPGTWMPHLTLAPRLHLEQLSVVARSVFEVLPVTLTFDRAALVDTSTGEIHPLPHPV